MTPKWHMLLNHSVQLLERTGASVEGKEPAALQSLTVHF
jgi:hypothetical protein